MVNIIRILDYVRLFNSVRKQICVFVLLHCRKERLKTEIYQSDWIQFFCRRTSTVHDYFHWTIICLIIWQDKNKDRQSKKKFVSNDIYSIKIKQFCWIMLWRFMIAISPIIQIPLLSFFINHFYIFLLKKHTCNIILSNFRWLSLIIILY